jgi:lysophospholipase L1-like esterase
MDDRVVGAASGRAGDCGYGLWRKLVNLAVAALLAVAFAQPACAAPARIVAFGDSLTAGLGLPIEEAFPAKLQAWLREHGLNAEVVNAGVSGDTTAGGLARLDWTMAEPADAVLVEFGANDALRAIDPKVAYKNLDEILSKLEARQAARAGISGDAGIDDLCLDAVVVQPRLEPRGKRLLRRHAVAGGEAVA